MEPWSSVGGIAKHLRVAQNSIYRRTEARGSPAHKIGCLWKFKLSEVDKWVRAGGAESDGGPTSKKFTKPKRRNS